MATAIFPNKNTAIPFRASLDDRHGWGFALLLLLIATLFVRPADLVPALNDWPVYQFLIVCCLVVSARATLRALAHQRLLEQPVTACMLVLLLAVGVSHLSHGYFWEARMSMYEVGKLMALYLLIIGVVNTPLRLGLLLRWLTITIAAVAVLALLDRFGFVDVAALESIKDNSGSAEGQRVLVDRIRGTGIFQDPNDFGLILVTGLILCFCFLCEPRVGWVRYRWIVPGGVLLYTLALTYSRGALLSLVCALASGLAYYRGGRWGGWSLLALPLVTFVFSGRMTDFNSVNEGTGQSRIQIWSDSLTIWRQHPYFGLGEGLLVDELSVVSHNSFLHCFAELGFFGGTAFLACFLAAGLGLWSLRNSVLGNPVTEAVPGTALPYAYLSGGVFAVLAAYAGGIMTISRQFVAPTYLILGIATATQCLLCANCQSWRIGNRFVAVALLSSGACLVAFYVAVRLLVHW